MVDSLLYFVKNTDELAGTLCHEVSHTIHHDTMTLMKQREKILGREIGAAVLFGPSLSIALWQAAFPQLLARCGINTGRHH